MHGLVVIAEVGAEGVVAVTARDEVKISVLCWV
jgi:hypothetical protein